MEAIITTKILIDLSVIRRNLRHVKTLSGKKVLFMVKSDAYGHGAIEVAKATNDDCDFFGVATIEEGISLRKAGIDKAILVAIASASELQEALEFGLTLAISSCEQMIALVDLKNKYHINDACPLDKGRQKKMKWLRNKIGLLFENQQNKKSCPKKNAESVYQNLKVHLKLDTGMHRLGFMEDELDCIAQIATKNGIEIEGIYSHLRSVNDTQLENFVSMNESLKKNFPNAIRHLCSSSSLFRSDMHFDMVRVGLCAYENAMTVVSEVIATNYILSGEHIGYGDFTLDHNANIAIVFGGYADGVARENPSHVSIRGQECNVVGRICMDMFAVETIGFMADIGEIVVLQGKGAEVSQVAAERDTIEYTVLTSWRGRTQRIYFDDKSGSKEKCKS